MEVDTSSTISTRQQFAEDLAVDAAEVAMDYFRNVHELKVESKTPLDFVSEADRNVEHMIRERIAEAYPNDDIVGEEGGGTEIDDYWNVDPIDGTANFLAGIPFWGVSIGYCKNGLPATGAICIPLLNILVSANKDTPGIRYNRSVKTDFRQSPIPTITLMRWGSPSSVREVEDIFLSASISFMNVRCSVVGSTFAALGMTHGYYQEQLHMWDVAVGYLLAQKAGLHARIWRNESDDKLTISILSPTVYEQIGDQLAQRKAESRIST